MAEGIGGQGQADASVWQRELGGRVGVGPPRPFSRQLEVQAPPPSKPKGLSQPVTQGRDWAPSRHCGSSSLPLPASVPTQTCWARSRLGHTHSPTPIPPPWPKSLRAPSSPGLLLPPLPSHCPQGPIGHGLNELFITADTRKILNSG